MKQNETKEQRAYQTPKIQDWGTVADLTEVGQTNPGGDLKSGSVQNDKGI